MQGNLTRLSEAGKEELEYRIPVQRERICRENPCRRSIAFVKECHLRIGFGTKTGMKNFIVTGKRKPLFTEVNLCGIFSNTGWSGFTDGRKVADRAGPPVITPGL